MITIYPHLYPHALSRHYRPMITALALMTLGACSALRPVPTPPMAFFALDDSASSTVPSRVAGKSQATLIISPPTAAAGFDSPHIIYVRIPHKLEYFAYSEWVEPPARMLGPLLVTAAGHTGAFGTVVLSPGSAAGTMRLDTQIVRLQHEFSTQPARVRFTLRATLIDERSRRALAWREFDHTTIAAGNDAYGGVVASNSAVQIVVNELADFCVEVLLESQKEAATQ